MPTTMVQRGSSDGGSVGLRGTSAAPPGHAWIGMDDTTATGPVMIFKGGDGVRHGIAGLGTKGTVTQGTDKGTGVTLAAMTGDITLNNANLAAATVVSFTLTDTYIGASDVLVFNHVSGGTIGAYGFTAVPAAGSAVIYVRNHTAGGLAEAVVLRFAVLKGAFA